MKEDKVDGGQVVLAWIAKCTLLAVPAYVLPRAWATHPHIAFGLGLCAGVILQHFVSPRGKMSQLVIELFLAIVGATLLSLWR